MAGRTLTHTVVFVDPDTGKDCVFAPGVDESSIPKKFGTVNPRAFAPLTGSPEAEEADPIGAYTETGEVPSSLDDLSGKELDALGMRQDPPIDLSRFRKVADKREILREAGVGDEPVAAGESIEP